MTQQLTTLYQKLGYTFKKKPFLKQALTHRSAGTVHNERLEFLGDAILELIITHALYLQFPEESEGTLSRLRSSLVNRDMLATIAQELSLGDHLQLGQGELKSGGFQRASILADALEAIFGAVFIEAGYETAREVILHLFESRLHHPSLIDTMKDPKTTLQEWLQAKQRPLPTYTLMEVSGPKDDQHFHAKCDISHPALSTEGYGETRRKAEQAAAKQMLALLKS